MLIPNRYRIVALFSSCALALILSVTCGGCVGTVRPTTEQGLAGQKTTSGSGDTLTVTDNPDVPGSGTTTVQGSGPLFVSNQTPGNQQTRSSGLAPTQVSVKTEGREFAYFSARDGSGSIELDPATGNPKSISFQASASDPLRALADVQAVKASVDKFLASEEGAYLKQVSADQRETIIRSFEMLAPVVGTALRAALGSPP